MRELTYNAVAHINALLKEQNIPYKLGFCDKQTASIEPLGHCACEGKENVFTEMVTQELKKYGLVAHVDIAQCRITLCEKIVKVVAAVLFDYNEKQQPVILATQRGYGELAGGFEFPGGKIEFGETPQQALKREIREELDADIYVGECIHTIEYDYPSFHLSMQCFACRIVSESFVLKEHMAAKWLTKDELNTVEWLPADIELVTILKEQQDIVSKAWENK